MSPGAVVGRIGLRTAVPVIHAVTNDEIVSRANFIDVACSVMRVLGSRGALQLRASRLPAAQLQMLAEGLVAAQAMTGAWLVINERIDIALACKARGLQLTSYSLDTAHARRLAPSLEIGASVHDVSEGMAAAADGADWLVAGKVLSPNRADGVAWVRTLAASTSIPVLAIGGLRVEHAETLRAAGLHGVAVIRGIWDAPNAERAASDYLSAYEHAAEP